MSKESQSSNETVGRFALRARERGEVYGLQSPDGAWAVCPSFEDEDADVVLFWSEQSEAAVHIREDWSDHAVTPVPLEEFVEAWLRGMHEDGSVVGLDWDLSLSGEEREPIEVARRLTDKP